VTLEILILIAFVIYLIIDWYSYWRMRMLLNASMAMNLYTYYFLADKYEDFTPKG